MSVEIFINIAPRESRAALLEGGVLQEIHIERARDFFDCLDAVAGENLDRIAARF